MVGRASLFSRLTEHGTLNFPHGSRTASDRATERWLTYVSLEKRLALEIVLNEDVERRAMEGELSLLEIAWRDAERIAGIADSLGEENAPADERGEGV